MTLPVALYAHTPDPAQPIGAQVECLGADGAAQGWTLADEHIFQGAG